MEDATVSTRPRTTAESGTPQASREIVSVRDLVVVYPDGTRAVDGITFSVNEGDFLGFLGPNGAGKSTTIKTLTTLLPKTSGQVTVGGLDLDRSPREIRKVIGVLAQETVLDVDLTGRENLLLFGRLQQMHGDRLEHRVDELLKVVELEDVAEKPAGRYSGGMRKRLDLASALVHEPKLLFLDEPTTGLDPQSRAVVWDYLARLNREDHVTIFLTTQYMDEADRLCDRLAIIDHGKLVGGGSPQELKASLGGETITLSFGAEADDALRARARNVLGLVPGVTHIVDSGEGVVASTPRAGLVIADIVTALSKEGIHPASLSISSPTLDDVFLRLTGRTIRTEELGRKTTEPFLS